MAEAPAPFTQAADNKRRWATEEPDGPEDVTEEDQIEGMLHDLTYPPSDDVRPGDTSEGNPSQTSALGLSAAPSLMSHAPYVSAPHAGPGPEQAESSQAEARRSAHNASEARAFRRRRVDRSGYDRQISALQATVRTLVDMQDTLEDLKDVDIISDDEVL